VSASGWDRGRGVSSSSDEKPAKPFQVLLYRSNLYSFPFQRNTNRLTDLTAHRLVEGERSSTPTRGLAFDMQWRNSRKQGSFPLSVHVSGSHLLQGKAAPCQTRSAGRTCPATVNSPQVKHPPSSHPGLGISSCWSPVRGFPSLRPHLHAPALPTHRYRSGSPALAAPPPRRDAGADTWGLQIQHSAFETHRDFCPSSSSLSLLMKTTGPSSTSPAELGPPAMARATLTQKPVRREAGRRASPCSTDGCNGLNKVMQEARGKLKDHTNPPAWLA